MLIERIFGIHALQFAPDAPSLLNFPHVTESRPKKSPCAVRFFYAGVFASIAGTPFDFLICSAGALTGTDFCLIFAPSMGYDEPETLPCSIRSICLIGADDGHRKTPLHEPSRRAS